MILPPLARGALGARLSANLLALTPYRGAKAQLASGPIGLICHDAFNHFGSAMAALFDPFALKSLTLRNRIAVPPMCQYSAENGAANAWHVQNYGAQARGGAGLVIVEATAVAPEGRISPNCLGIWNDDLAQVLAPVAQAIKAHGAVAGLQIAHAGRKANANRPWEGDDHIAESDPRYWQTLAPSALAFGKNLPRLPKAMTLEEIKRVQADFVAAAKRALEAGFEWLEVHFAHGYLGQSFFNAKSNQRDDAYGGSFENRSRFLRETFAAVRAVWPEKFPLTIRFGVTEFDGTVEKDLEEAIALSQAWKEDGLDLLSVSIGFTTPEADIPWAKGPFLGPIAKRIKDETGLPVASAWGFGSPEIAQAAVQKGELDLVMVGKAHLANPHWAFEAARALHLPEPAAKTLPPAYAYWLARY